MDENQKVVFLTRVEMSGRRYEKDDTGEFCPAIVNYLITTKQAKLLEKEIKGKKPQGGE